MINKKTDLQSLALVGVAFALFYINQNVKRHVQSCEEGSKNTKRVLWLLFSAVVTEVVIKGLSMLHTGAN